MLHWIAGAGPEAIAFVCVSLLLCAACLGLVWRDYHNGWKISVGGKARWLVILLGISFGFAIDARNPYAYEGQPQITRTGVLVAKYRAIYRHRHWIGYGVLACVDTCAGDVPLVELNESVAAAWEKAGTGRVYSVAYLAQKEPVEIGDYAVTAHLAVALRDSASGQSIYALDIQQHWARIDLFALSGLLCLITLIFCVQVAATNPDPEDVPSASDGDPAARDQVTSLGIES